MRIVISCGCEPRSRQLESGGADLTRLALDLGYSSHSHFTSSFRVLFGVRRPPSTATSSAQDPDNAAARRVVLCHGRHVPTLHRFVDDRRWRGGHRRDDGPGAAAASPGQSSDGARVAAGGAARRQAKDYDSAIAALRTSLKLEPDAPTGLFALGAVYAAKGDTAQSLEWLTRARTTRRVDMTQMEADNDLKSLLADARLRRAAASA